jgi:hypothetical protein
LVQAFLKDAYVWLMYCNDMTLIFAHLGIFFIFMSFCVPNMGPLIQDYQGYMWGLTFYSYMESTCMKNRKLTIYYKIHNKLCPPYLSNCLPPVTWDVNNYNLRNNQNYVLPRYRLRTSASSFIPSTVSLWNNLDMIRYINKKFPYIILFRKMTHINPRVL